MSDGETTIRSMMESDPANDQSVLFEVVTVA
jgi:hypothetical protein